MLLSMQLSKPIFPSYSIGDFINQPFNPTNFEILLFEEMEEPDVDDVHKHTFYEILWVDEGHSQQTIDYQSYELGPSSLFFISPGQVHEFEAWQPLKGGTILFTSDFFLLNQSNQDTLFELSFLDNTYAYPKLDLDTFSFQEIRHIIQLLINEKKRTDYRTDILRTLLQLLALQIQRNLDQQQGAHPYKASLLIYKQFKTLLEEHYPSEYTVDDYANLLNITQHHLNRSSKNITGKTASAIIRDRKILEAKRLLTFTDASINQIATGLSYYDGSYFAKLFKKETGMPPGDFRVLMSEKYRNK